MKCLTLVMTAAVLACFAVLSHSREKIVVLQFDDGRACHYDYAFPILESYGLKGSFGIVTGKLDADPFFLTKAQVIEMAAAGHEIHDHTLRHHPYFWGDVANAPAWRDTIQRSLDIFASMGLTTRGWNQPGGTGQGWSQALRDTLALFYDYAAGRVGLEWYQEKNFHWHLLDDPYSLGRGCVYSWGYNGGNSQKQELEIILSKIARGVAQGLTTIPVFHNVLVPGASLRHAGMADDSTAWALAQVCSFVVANNFTVLRMEDAVYRAQHSHEFIDKWGEQITNPGFLDDIDQDCQADGWFYAPYDTTAASPDYPGSRVVAFLQAGVFTYVFGPEKGTATLQFVARADVTRDITVAITKHEIDYSGVSETFCPTLTDQWAAFSYTFDVPENIDRLQIEFVQYGKIYMNHVSLKLTGTPVWIPKTPTPSRVTLWPNPASGRINVLLPGITDMIRVYDVKGRFVGEFAASADRASWSVREWPSGIYFVSVLSGTRVAGTSKFMVIR